MCGMLVTQDSMVIQVILDGLGNILKMAGPQAKIIADVIEEAGGVERIEALQQHDNIEIYKLAYSLIERYFQAEVSNYSTCINCIVNHNKAYVNVIIKS